MVGTNHPTITGLVAIAAHAVADVGDHPRPFLGRDNQPIEAARSPGEEPHPEGRLEEEILVDIHDLVQIVSLAVMEEAVAGFELVADVPERWDDEGFPEKVPEQSVDEAVVQSRRAGPGVAVVILVEDRPGVGDEQRPGHHAELVGWSTGHLGVDDVGAAEVGSEVLTWRHRTRDDVGVEEDVDDVVVRGLVEVRAAMTLVALATRCEHGPPNLFLRRHGRGKSTAHAVLGQLPQGLIGELLLLELGQLLLLRQRRRDVVRTEVSGRRVERLPREILSFATVEHQLALQSDVEDGRGLAVNQDVGPLCVVVHDGVGGHRENVDVVRHPDRDRHGAVGEHPGEVVPQGVARVERHEQRIVRVAGEELLSEARPEGQELPTIFPVAGATGLPVAVEILFEEEALPGVGESRPGQHDQEQTQ